MLLQAYEQYQFAGICYQRAATLKADSFEWAYYLGTAQAGLGEHRQAVDSFRKTLSLDPRYLPARLDLAESLLKLGEWEESGAVCREILKQYPAAAAAHYGLGRAKAGRGDLRGAVEDYLQACKLLPGFGAAHYALALAYRDLGDSPKAKEQFSLYERDKLGWPSVENPLLDAIQQLKSGPLDYLKRAIQLAGEARYEESIREHKKALEMDPGLLQAHINLLNLYARQGNLEEAEKHYRAAMEINPNRAEVHYDYGLLLLNRGRDSEAAGSFERALQINPFYAHAHNNLGFILERQGRLKDAIEHYRSAIENDPNYRLARFNLGRALVASGKNQEAIEEFSKILTPEDEDTPRFMYALAAAYVRAGDLEKAFAYTKEARQRAEALGQTALAAAIEKDLKKLELARNPR